MQSSSKVLVLAGVIVQSIVTAVSFAGDAPGAGLTELTKQKIQSIGRSLPSTARQFETFTNFSPRSTIPDVLKKAGMPDAERGSGIIILEYRLTDGSKVHIGTPDFEVLLYIDLISQRGQRTRLMSAEE